MKKTTTIAISCLVLLAGCAKKNIPTKSVPEKDAAAEIKAKYSPEQIAQGKTIYMNNCGKCHELHQPGEYNIKSWKKILPDMSSKSELSKNDAALVRAWVMTNAKAS